ncbi:hypothetical protein BRC91_12280 [Halobacteriales archaeon QS_4_62_28]|nr:MAG: hypothetical protein BRC91_12280 [Halobacteriales archaeon QS_4_62_28]
MARTQPVSPPAAYSLQWGDLHKHLTGPGTDISRLDDIVSAGADHLDFLAVFCYPFKWYRKGRERGIREETVGNRPEFANWWAQIQSTAQQWLSPDEFVTFPAYEWHGNRRRWGDHHVVYRTEGYPLDDEWELPALCENMAPRDALVIPHHTGYLPGERGKDWDTFDPELSPVTEVYSSHGSSEGAATPVPMDENADMGPRTSGGTFRDALDRGIRVGAVASNDGPGLPGTWNNGIVGLWATELTRDGIWDAIRERRTYGVTGDRIELWWELDGTPMGGLLEASDSVTARISVDCPQPLDRVELVHNGRVARTYTHPAPDPSGANGLHRVLVEFGWGPTSEYGDFDSTECSWSGTVNVTNGDLRRVWPRFVGLGQTHELTDDGCHFDLVTARGEPADRILPESAPKSHRQALIVEYVGTIDTDLVVSLDDHDDSTVSHEAAVEDTHLFPFLEESWDRLATEFDLGRDDIDNEDIVYHNARKVRINRAFHQSACGAGVVFDDLPVADGWNYYYVRASQDDGQYAWSSPIWIDN